MSYAILSSRNKRHLIHNTELLSTQAAGRDLVPKFELSGDWFDPTDLSALDDADPFTRGTGKSSKALAILKASSRNSIVLSYFEGMDVEDDGRIFPTYKAISKKIPHYDATVFAAEFERAGFQVENMRKALRDVAADEQTRLY